MPDPKPQCYRCGKDLKTDSRGMIKSVYCDDCKGYEQKAVCLSCGRETKDSESVHCDDCLRRHPELRGTGWTS